MLSGKQFCGLLVTVETLLLLYIAKLFIWSLHFEQLKIKNKTRFNSVRMRIVQTFVSV